MSKTQIMWLFFYFSGIIASYVKAPIYGLLTYIYTFYTQFTWGGSLKRKSWSLWVALAFIGSYILKRSSEQKLSHFKMPQLKWLILFLANMLFVGLFAVLPEENNKMIIDLAKLVILYFLIICVVRTKMHYKMFLWMQLWGNFLFGWQGFNTSLTHGRLEGVGGPQTNTSNGLANHMIMILPFMNNFFFYGNKWEKIGAVLAAPWILNAIILCNSRAAFLGVFAIAIIAIIRSDRETRKKIIAGMVLASILFIFLADERFWKRMDTIGDQGQRGSGRIDTWIGAIEMIKDHPFGAGGDGWLYYSPVYIPEIVEQHGGELRSVHNSYLKVATNYGIQGLLLYILFIVGTLKELKEIRKRVGTDDDTFYHSESIAIELAFWGFLVAGTFGARPFFEAMFWFSAIGCALSNMQQSDLKDRKNKETQISEKTHNAN